MNRFFVPITSNDYLIAIELLRFPMEEYKTSKVIPQSYQNDLKN